jgi:hypothetical protein
MQPTAVAPPATTVVPPATTVVAPPPVKGIALDTPPASETLPAQSAPAAAVPAPPAEPLEPPEAPPRAKAQSESNPDGPNLTWSAPPNAAVGQSFDVAVALSSQQPLAKITSQLHFDGTVLQLDSVDAGALIPASLQSASAPRINQHAGVVQYVVAFPKDSPMQGDGDVMVLHFKALGAAASTPITLQFVATGADGRGIRAGVPGPLAININP